MLVRSILVQTTRGTESTSFYQGAVVEYQSCVCEHVFVLQTLLTKRIRRQAVI